MPLMKLPDFAADLADMLAARATKRVDTPIIQPAEPFLDMAGEDLRRRIFMTESETGASLCLRPEFTIPVCLSHIEGGADTPRRYAYLGEVFRQRRDGPNEFYQAGIEDLGDSDMAAADARAIADAHGIVSALVTAPLTVTLGDQAVFEAVVAALGLPSGWQKRLIHAFGNLTRIEQLLAELAEPLPVTGLTDEVRALVAAGEPALIAHLDRTMVETGYSTNASRSPQEIAARLAQKLKLAEIRLSPAAMATLTEFLSLSVPLAEAPEALAAFAARAGLSLDGALVRFGERVAALQGAGLPASGITYRAAFGRPLDYYTGLVFEVTDAEAGTVFAGGGRFDRLLTLLGADRHIPAVGFALWLDRIEAKRGHA